MVRRVILSPEAVKVSRPGFAAETAPLQGLIFSSDNVALGGSVRATITFPPSASLGGSNYETQTQTIVLPPGTGVPVAFFWGELVGMAEMYFDETMKDVILHYRYPQTRSAEYLIYRSRT